MSEGPINGEFREYRRMILSALERIDRKMAEDAKTLTRIEKDITALQVKSGMWGAVAAIVVSGILQLIFKG